MAVEPSGRLELTWTNKHLRLLADQEGGYQWVPPSDYRVAEVRLLHDVEEVGETQSARSRAQDNLLITGDALNALTSLCELPELAREHVGKVKLVYLDPPFNTQQAFEHYDDALEHSVWLTMMRDRLLQIRKLLSPDGSVWVHCDDSEQAYLKVMMDEVMGRDSFVGVVIWEKADTLRNDARQFSGSHDYLLVYGKSDGWRPNRLPRTSDMNLVYKNPDNDPRGPWLASTLISPSYRSSGDFEVITPSGARHRAPTGTSWRVPRDTYERLLTENGIWFGRSGNATPQRKLFLSEAGDRVVDTVWHVKEVGGNRQSKAEIKGLFPEAVPFATPKPERLMQRIIQIASNPGDVVLDCFAGSGTTAAVAHKMGRRWVAVESSRDTVETFTQPRLENVVAGDDPGGITKDVGWEGGGGFRVIEVGPSMFAESGGRLACRVGGKRLAGRGDRSAARLLVRARRTIRRNEGTRAAGRRRRAREPGRRTASRRRARARGEVRALRHRGRPRGHARAPGAPPRLARAEDPGVDPRRVPDRARMAVAAPKTLDVDEDAIAAIAARLDLREPNVEALRAIAYTAAQHYEIEGRSPPYECVIDVATGVGKTYVLAAAIEYYAALGRRHFAVITPGRTILEKTIANFTPGHPKSLLEGMDVEPLIVTAENFATVDHAEEERVRLYVFSVQSLLKPTGKAGRKTHTFHETLGDAFYEYLKEREDLVLFADEHHVYYGKAFSQAIRDLEPSILVGLTATPHKDTPREQIVYAYPLAHAIADRLVKTPVIVGRHDERKDERTKLADGMRLLEAKRVAVERYCTLTGAKPVNPVMLVIATTIEEAELASDTMRDPAFFEGRYADSVLTVHSKSPDVALAALEQVEDLESPVRVIVSVGMLKEGWDVKNVYAICSLRPMLSELLQEQTLGRGLRLPFGRYTDVRMLDSLEVIAHDKYDQLLRKKGIIDQEFVDWRTRLVVHTDPLGDQSVTVETTETIVEVEVGGSGSGVPALEELGAREQQVGAELAALAEPLSPRGGRTISLPRLTMTPVRMSFSLNDVTDLDAFEKLGKQLAVAPQDDLRREEIVAEVDRSADGLVVTRLGTRRGERVEASAETIPLEEARTKLVDSVLHADVVTLRLGEEAGAERIVDAFLRGLGDDAERILGGFLATAAGRLVRMVTSEHRRFLAHPEYEKVVEVEEFGPERTARAETSADRTGKWTRGIGYIGYAKSLYDQDWFDSGTEKALAVILDDADEIELWCRLQTGDLKIVWESDGRQYAPDFIAVEKEGTHWVIEPKADRDLASAAVKGKELAATRWAQHVSAQTGTDWRYLLVGETDVAEARGAWSALRKLGKG